MANPFDQFDAPAGKSNPFDQFDEPPKPVGGFGASAKQAMGALVKGAGQAAEDFLPAAIGKDNAVKKYGQSVIDANPTAVQGFSDIADSPWMAAKEATGNAAGSMGSMLGLRALGMGITAASPLTGPFAPATALAGQAVANVGPFVAAALPSFGGIREKQIAKDPNSTASMQDKALAAAGAGTVGLIEGKFGPQAWAMKAMTKEGRAQLAKGLAETTLAKGVGYGALKGAAVEGAEELVQNPIEQLSAYEDPRTPHNIKETLFGGAMGAIGGGVLGGATGAANQMLDRTPPAAPNLAPTDQAPPTGGVVPPPAPPAGPTQSITGTDPAALMGSTLGGLGGNANSSFLDGAREAEVQQIVAASGGNPGALAKVAIASIQSGASGEIQLQQANAADQAAYEQATAEQDKQAAEQDSIDKPITSGPIAEAAMSEEDKRAILFSNKTVADGGKQYVGTQDGDILNGLGKPYPNRLAAARRANMEGKDWTIAPVFDGFVARRKDANGPSTEIQPGDTGSTGGRSTDSPASVGVGATDGNGVGAQSGRSPDAVLDHADQLPGGVSESAVDRFDVTHAGNAAVADPKNADVVSAYNRTQFATNTDGSTRRVGRDHFESWANSGGVTSDVGSQYDGHGIAKGNPLGALLNILTNGINTSRRFDSAPLTPVSSAAGAGSGLGSANGAYKDGPFILLGARGKSILDGIHTVLVSDEVAASIPALQQRFPSVRFVSHSNAQSVLSQDSNVQNAAPRADTTPAAQAVEAPAVVESNAAASEGVPAAGPASVEGGGVDQGTPEQAIEAKADEIMGLIEAMGGNTSITRESTIALIKEKGMDAADKSIAGFKKHIADTKKQISYRDKSQPQEQVTVKRSKNGYAEIKLNGKKHFVTPFDDHFVIRNPLGAIAKSDNEPLQFASEADAIAYAANTTKPQEQPNGTTPSQAITPTPQREAQAPDAAGVAKSAKDDDVKTDVLRAQLRKVETDILLAAPRHIAAIGDIEAASRSASVPKKLKDQRKQIKDELRQLRDAAQPAASDGVAAAPEAGKPAEPVAQDDPHFEAAKALLDAQKKSTGNVIAEARVRKQVRDLAEKVPEGSKAALVLDTAATRLGMGEGKLKGLEFAPAVTATPVEQPAQASTSRPGEPTAEQIESVGDVVRITKSAGKEIKRTVNARDAMKTLNERAEALQTLAEACKK